METMVFDIQYFLNHLQRRLKIFFPIVTVQKNRIYQYCQGFVGYKIDNRQWKKRRNHYAKNRYLLVLEIFEIEKKMNIGETSV